MVVVVIEVVVSPSFAYVGRHAYRVQDEIEFSTEVFHPFRHEVFEVFDAGGVGGYHDGSAPLSEFVDVAHADGDRSIGQYQLRALFAGAFGYLPCDGFVVEGTEYQAAFSFQQIVRHKFPY